MPAKRKGGAGAKKKGGAKKQKKEKAPPVVAHICVNDANKAIEFYCKAFGAELKEKHPSPDGKKIMHAWLMVQGGSFYVVDDFKEMDPEGKSHTAQAHGGSPVSMHLNVEDADALFAQAVEAGCKSMMKCAPQFWGQQFGMVECPFGIKWSIAHPIELSIEEKRKMYKEQFHTDMPEAKNSEDEEKGGDDE